MKEIAYFVIGSFSNYDMYKLHGTGAYLSCGNYYHDHEVSLSLKLQKYLIIKVSPLLSNVLFAKCLFT